MRPVPALTDNLTTLQAIMQGLRDNLVEIANLPYTYLARSPAINN
jgi:hypothetical protein